MINLLPVLRAGARLRWCAVRSRTACLTSREIRSTWWCLSANPPRPGPINLVYRRRQVRPANSSWGSDESPSSPPFNDSFLLRLSPRHRERAPSREALRLGLAWPH